MTDTPFLPIVKNPCSGSLLDAEDELVEQSNIEPHYSTTPLLCAR